MQQPIVTVVIPVKNEARYINKCLMSICNQTYPSDLSRIIVVDNGSTDHTVSLARSFEIPDRLQILIKTGGTIAAVRNFGAAHATSQFIAFLDGDCLPSENWLETGIRLLQDHEEAGCVGFVGEPPDSSASWVERTWHLLCSTGRVNGTSTVLWLSSFNLIMRNELFRQVGGFDETLITCEDSDLGYRLSAHTKLLLSDESMVQHLDEPKNLRNFFLKELWRGKSSMHNFLKSNQKKHDLLSVAVPIIYLIVLVVGIIAALAQTVTYSEDMAYIVLSCLVVIFSVPLLNVFYKTRRLLNIRQTVLAYFLSIVYLVARGLVIINHDKQHR